jgi:hypothetical protein
MRALILALIAASAAGGGGAARADELPRDLMLNLPAKETLRLRRQRQIMTGVGFGVFGATYLPVATVGLLSGNWFNFIPVGGPMFSGVSLVMASNAGVRVMGGLFIADAIAQMTGLVVGIVGAATTPKKPPSIALAPFAVPGAGGVALSGRF